MHLLTQAPEAFIAHLESLRVRRAYIKFGQRPEVSHPSLEGILEALLAEQPRPDHEAVFLEIGAHTGALLGAFVHRTRRGQAAGGLRHWPYQRLGDFLKDGLRLSQGMTRKNALAGLYWGGGKGVIARQPGTRHRDPGYRSDLYREYGQFVTSLRGLYVTAEDVGTSPADVADVFKATRFVTCIPPEVGGSGNPSIATATGVLCAMEGALEHLGMGNIEGKKVVVQGLGNVGSSLVEQLLHRGVGEVVASDISEERVLEAKSRFSGRHVTLKLARTGEDEALFEPCDVLAPCALGGVLNAATIPKLNALVVCGAANNQLENEDGDAQALFERNIVYVPDFLANRMGIVRCANEQYGTIPEDPSILRHLGRGWENSVYAVTRRVLAAAAERGASPLFAARDLADELSQEVHPIWGHRGQVILQSLLDDHWQTGGRGSEPLASGPVPTLKSPLIGQ